MEEKQNCHFDGVSCLEFPLGTKNQLREKAQEMSVDSAQLVGPRIKSKVKGRKMVRAPSSPYGEVSGKW